MQRQAIPRLSVMLAVRTVRVSKPVDFVDSMGSRPPATRRPSTVARLSGRYVRAFSTDPDGSQTTRGTIVTADEDARNAATRVSRLLLQTSASERIIICCPTVPDHRRDERGRFHEDLPRLKKLCFARFHCARNVQSPNPTPDGRYDRAGTSNEVHDAQRSYTNGSALPECHFRRQH